MFRFRKLNINVAIIGRKVKTTKPNSQGERKSRPLFISLRLIGDILRNEASVGNLGNLLVSSSSMAALLFDEQILMDWAGQFVDLPNLTSNCAYSL
jgi:hypothetical protein